MSTMIERDASGRPGKVKIMIAVPSRGNNWYSDFGISLAAMVGCTMGSNVGPNIELILNNALHAGLCMNRISLARKAIEHGCGYVLFLDDDMRLPGDLLLALLQHNKDIIGVNYVRKELPPRTVAQGFDGECVYTTKNSTGLQEVKSLGFGGILIKTRVFTSLKAPWFFEDPVKEIGEDVHFCYKAREAGFKIYVDHDLSKDVIHMGPYAFGHNLCDQWNEGGAE